MLNSQWALDSDTTESRTLSERPGRHLDTSRCEVFRVAGGPGDRMAESDNPRSLGRRDSRMHEAAANSLAPELAELLKVVD